ncbi:nucleoside/nucleotide kinase family protein [Flexivirga caeni]|uniref:Nucleoside/nucleotide kinase family protein n=1 Tax=Flexivirga caeni TaxID=2294115 RepID=A0A3M9MHC1_9MICO|nr:nucleoside/nucleotide kinase family protein [Flexivirga caeni]
MHHDLDLAFLTQRAERLIAQDGRRLLAIAGAPGAGKSTLAAALLAALPQGSAALVPQDGFHLADNVLTDLSLRDRKGAPETFDASGFHALLQRLSHNTEPVVYAPQFHRELEAAVAGAIGVPAETPLVVVEGNYLLLDDEPWAANHNLFDEAWFLTVDDVTRRERLIRRHQNFGKSSQDAVSWTMGSDERNAALVRSSASFADLIITADAPRLH